jgi:hypothetical protein
VLQRVVDCLHQVRAMQQLHYCGSTRSTV